MTEIKLTKRYPQSRTEDITDAFMRGYEQGRTDGLKVGRQIILAVVESYLTESKQTETTGRQNKRKTESDSEKPNNSTISKTEQVETMSCQECKHWDCLINADWECTLKECNYEPKDEPKDEPQTCEECEHWNDTEDGCADRHGCKDEPQTCDNCKLKGSTKWCNNQVVCRAYKPKDEPQTDCPWK